MVVVRGGNNHLVIISKTGEVGRLWVYHIYTGIYRDRQRQSVIIWFNGEMISIK